MNKLYIGYDENIEDFRIGTWEEINSFDSITLKDTLEDFEISEIIDFIQDELNMATVLKVKVNKFEFIKDLEEINLIIEKLAGGEREIKLEEIVSKAKENDKKSSKKGTGINTKKVGVTGRTRTTRNVGF